MQPNARDYLVSLGAELRASANRIRSLIGDAHWPSDGAHKEAIIRSVIERHLPQGLVAARGFVVGGRPNSRCSREQDLVIVDALACAPLFSQSGLAIAHAHQVMAAVSVKSSLRKSALMDSISTLWSVPSSDVETQQPGRIWRGSFHFCDGLTSESTSRRLGRTLASLACEMPATGNRSGDVIIATSDSVVSTVLFQPSGSRVKVFRCDQLAPATFIASLIDHIATIRGRHAQEAVDLLGSEAFTLEFDSGN